LFLYVGVEVLAGDTIIAYGVSQGVTLDKATVFTGYTMAAMVFGYLIGIVAIPKYFTQETAMKACASLGILFTLGIVFTEGMVSLSFVALLGLANSLVVSVLLPLAQTGVGRCRNAYDIIFVMGIAGVTVIPLFYGEIIHIIGSHATY